MESTVRLQKYLADRGVASRREAARLIREGHVTVDRRLATEPGLRVDPQRSTVHFDGRLLAIRRAPPRTVMLHKPRGCVCSRNGQGRPTVFEHLCDIPETLRPVGRLDADSEGLLLLSNDGALIQALTHPRHGSAKTYRVEVVGTVDEGILAKLRAPMTLDGYRIRPVSVQRLDRSRTADPVARLIFTLREGRNRQIRKMCEQVGLRVRRLVRVEQAGLRLGRLPAGQWRDLTDHDLQKMRTALSGPSIVFRW
jgi:23S rRNA pseudouridine2605 synthase